MADILETARRLEEQERATAARQSLTPPDEFPTADFTGAPATVDAVLRTADPARYRGEFERMNVLEKGVNAVGAGVQNYQKAEAMEDVVDASVSAKEGLASRFGGDIESESDDLEVQKTIVDAMTGTRSDIAYKKEMSDKQEKAINEYLRLTAYDEDYKMPEVVTRASQATEGKGFFDSIGAYVSEVAKDPLNYAIYLTGSSLGAIAPSLAMSMVGGGILARGFKLGRTAQAFQSAMMGYGSYNVEFGSYLQNYLQEKGYDLTSADSIRQAMANEDLGTLTKKAQMRAIAVGMFDAFSAWVAPIRLNPSNALRYLRRAKEATPTKLVPTSRLYNFGKGAENLAMQTTLQGVLGGAGEAFGQLVNGEQINWGDVFAEAFGELTSAPVEVIGLATSANAKFNADSEYCKNANTINETTKQVIHAVQAVSQTMKEGETLQQWAQKVGEGTPLFAYAQDLVEQGISEKIRETNPELADKIEEAAEQKTDITLSMGDVLTLATKDEALAQSVVNESRIDADGMSPRQAQEFLKNGKEEAAKKFQEIVDKVKPDVERRKEIKTVVDKLRDDLVAQGMTKELADASTMPWTAKLAVLCKQLDTTAEDVMNRLNLQVKRQQAEQQQKVDNAVKALGSLLQNNLPDIRGNTQADAQALDDFIKSDKNPEAKQQAIKELLDLMSTEHQKDVVKDNKASTQKVYQKDINARVQEAAKKAGVNLADMESPVTRALIRQTIVNDAVYVVKSNPTAVGWYDLKVRQCLAYAEELFPELNPKGEKFDPNELFRFLYVLAVTSNGQKVEAQFAQTVDIYKEYKKTKALPVKAFGPQGTAIAHALKNFPNLTERFGGMDNMRKFFMTAWTVRQMTMMGFDVSGEAVDEIVRGAMILGPKIGNGFLSNMYGIFSALTMDRWFMRTWGRWTGTLIEFNPKTLDKRLVELKAVLRELKGNKELSKFVMEELGFDISKALNLLSNDKKRKDIVNNESALDGERGELVKMVQKAASTIMASDYHKKFVSQWKESGQKFYDSVMRVNRTLLTDKQSPSGGGERKYIRGLFNDALEVLHTKSGLERLTMADLQALLWYAEKKIYENTKTEGDTYVEDYSSDEAPDYANAMYEIALKEGVHKDKLDSIKERVEKEIADEQRRIEEGSNGSEGSNGIGHDTLSAKEKVHAFRTLVFGAMRSLRKLSSKGDKKQSQRSKTVYGKKWEVGSSAVLPADRSDGVTISDNDVRGNRQDVRGNEPTPIAEWVAGNALKGRLKEVKTSFGKSAENTSPKFQEFAPTEQSATTFLEALRVAKQSQGIAGLCVEEKSIEELTGKDADHSQCRIFLSEDKKCGFVIKNGDDLVSVFSTRGHGAEDAIVECAIAAGARRLDCFNTVLPEFYASHGFRPVARLAFDPNYAPEGWDYNFFNKFNEGKPDIIFMVLDNDFNGFINEDDLASLPETKDYGATECNEALEKYSKNNVVVQESVDEATASFQKQKTADSLAQVSPLAQSLYQSAMGRQILPSTNFDPSTPQGLLSLLQLAFHGSPYWFEAFSTKNIGSGEGAQAHGWGLYFALSKAVAEAYKNRLNNGKMSVAYKGRPISELERKVSNEFDAWERKRPLRGGPGDGLTDEYLAWSNRYWDLLAKKKFIYRLSAPWFDAKEELSHLEGENEDWARNEILPYLERRKAATLYTVDIPEDDVMLREDARFEDQPPKVQEALKKIFQERYSKEKAETERAAWLEEIKGSQALKDAFWKMPETYKAFIALAEKEGPQAFSDITLLMKKLKKASEKDAKVARDANLQNGVDEPLEEVEEDLWSELGNSKLMYPYDIAKSDKYANLFTYTKSVKAREKSRKAWLTAVRKVIRSFEDELMDNTAEGLKKLAETEGPSIFLDEARLFDKMMPYLRKDAEETFEDEKEDRDEDFTLDDWAEELFYNLRDIGSLGHLQGCASKYQVEGEGLLLQGVKGYNIYDQLARSLGGEMKASMLLNKHGIQGIRYNGHQDGECAVVFDDAMIKIIETLQQLAYHGTGFNDPILKFSLDHVGEGEGAQAHGYGLYFALAKAVAQGYRDKLTNGQYRIGETDSNEYRTELESKIKKAKGKDKQKWIDRLTAFDEWHGHKNMDAVKEAHDNGEITDDAFNWFEKEVRPNVQTDGGLYLVDIPEDYEMLNEMLQFEAQPEQVKAALRKLVKNEFSSEQLTKLYKEQWYHDAMYQMEDYSYTFSVPDVVLRALDELAQEEGPRIFAHEKKVLARISDALNEAAEEKYLEDQEYYDEQAHGRKKGIDIARDEIIEEGGLNKNGLFWTLHNVAEENYPSLLKGKVKFEFTDSLHGFQIYNQIAEFVGGKKEASALLNKYGIKGIRYNGFDDGECAVVWDEESIKIQERLAQVKAQLESVAAQSARGDFVPNNTASRGNGMGGLMTLMQNADKSTFMHESAHAWLDLDTMLACDIAEKMERGEELTEGETAFMKNLGGFFRWGQQEGKIDLGVTEDIATVATAVKRWSQMTVHQQRGMHELFAEGFEAYLYEGVAPNKEMQSIFARFKTWLKELYQRINYTPMVLSPEVRKLYDLMFASEQQAQDTETRMGFRALINAEMSDRLGMTPEELEAYNKLAEQATLETEGLVAKSVHGAMRIFGRVQREEEKRLRQDRADDIAERTKSKLDEPRFKAINMLNGGTKLSEKALRDFGMTDETIAVFAERGWIAEDGMSPIVFASMVGTDDAMALMGDILEIKTEADAETEAIKEIAYEEHKEAGTSGDKFTALQANLAAYNQTRSRLLTAEYNALARKLGSQQMLVSAARDYAQEQIGKIAVNKLRPKSYMAAERRNIKEAEEAFRKGDFQKALEAKRAQIVNHEMARAAMEAQDRYNRGVGVAKRALKSKTVHPQFKRVVDALLSMHSIKAMTDKEREEFKLGEPLTQDKIDEFVKTLEDNGTPVDGLKGFLGTRTPAVEMTVNESRDFFEIVKEVTALGRNLLRQNLTEDRQRVTDVCEEAEEHLTEAADAQNRPVDTHQHVAHTEKQRRRKSLSDFLLSHTKIATWFRIFDQNKAGGFFWNLFIRSANRCANFENEQRAKAARYLADKFATVFKKNMEEDPVIIEGFSEPFTHGMRLAVALNWGNESNRERLTTNDPRFTPDAIQAIFEHLTEADWRAVEAVWQLFESFRPMIEEKELRVRGIAPEWIEYSPFEVTTAEGKKITVSGGYYPVKYDPEASNSADKYTSADDVEQEMKGAYQSATTRESFIKSRVKGKVTNMPLRLDLNPLYEGLNDVIHDIAWHEWLIDTKKVLDGVSGVQRGLREVIKERYGSQVTREIEMWRTDIAVGGRNPASVTWAAKLASCIGVSTMGYSLTSAVVQLTGMGYVIPRVGVNAFVVGLAKYMSNPFKASKIIREKSKAMNLRNMTQFKEISQIRNRLEQGHGLKTWLHDHAYVLISLVQSIADSVCWLSAYEKYSREENISEDKLIAMCDQVVIDTQSSGNINDLSRIERDRAGLSRLFTIFYSWMNAALNLAVGEYLGETNKFKKTANLLFMCAVMPVVEKAFRDSLTGKDDDDDDDEDPLKTYVREPLSAIAEYNLGLFTGVTRECASAASNFVSGDRIYGYSGPAGVRLMAHVNNAFAVASNPNEKKVMKAIIDLLGDLRGIPSVQINRTIKGIRAVNSGQAEGIDAIKAPLFGYKGRVYD